jgi:hypothetical protein
MGRGRGRLPGFLMAALSFFADREISKSLRHRKMSGTEFRIVE